MEQATLAKTEETFQLSDRVNRISPSPTMMVLQAADQLKAKGVDVADFGAGEPDFPTPEHIKRAAVQALEEKPHEIYAGAGYPRRCARRFASGNNTGIGALSFQSAECIVNVGGKHTIFNAVCSLINAGDEVMIPAPFWVS